MPPIFWMFHMKCVCPMGGDRTCPDNCPLAVWAGLSPTDRKAQRKPIAEGLYRQGFTMEQIATQLGVGVATIHRDLKEFFHDEKTQPRPSKRGRKGEGRPKGSAAKPRPTDAKPPTPKQAANEPRNAKIIGLADAGLTVKEIAQETGIGERAVSQIIEHERIRREISPVDWNSIPATAQQKITAEVKRYTHKLAAEFEVRCREDCQRWLNDVSLPNYTQKLEKLEHSISNRKGIMDRVTYRKILSCLHPDRVTDESLKKRYEEAFRLFTELEKRVLDEKESPTEFRRMPRTYEELMAMKAKVQAERRAKRAHANVAQR